MAVTIDVQARIDQLESEREQLMIFTMDLVKWNADNVGKDAYIKLLQESLHQAEIALKREKNKNLGLQKSLTEVRGELRHMTLMGKMQKEFADSLKESKAPMNR
jgi:hypothetical protein